MNPNVNSKLTWKGRKRGRKGEVKGSPYLPSEDNDNEDEQHRRLSVHWTNNSSAPPPPVPSLPLVTLEKIPLMTFPLSSSDSACPGTAEQGRVRQKRRQGWLINLPWIDASSSVPGWDSYSSLSSVLWPCPVLSLCPCSRIRGSDNPHLSLGRLHSKLLLLRTNWIII